MSDVKSCQESIPRVFMARKSTQQRVNQPQTQQALTPTHRTKTASGAAANFDTAGGDADSSQGQRLKKVTYSNTDF